MISDDSGRERWSYLTWSLIPEFTEISKKGYSVFSEERVLFWEVRKWKYPEGDISRNGFFGFQECFRSLTGGPQGQVKVNTSVASGQLADGSKG